MHWHASDVDLDFKPFFSSVPPRTPHVNPKSQTINPASRKVLQAVTAIASKGLQTDRTEEALALINVAVAALMGENVEPEATGSDTSPPNPPLPSVPPTPPPPGFHAPGTPLPQTPLGEAAPSTPAPSTPGLHSDAMAIMPFKGANSSSHPKEYAMYRRFCEKNAGCQEVVKAWESRAELFCIFLVCFQHLRKSVRDSFHLWMISTSL